MCWAVWSLYWAHAPTLCQVTIPGTYLAFGMTAMWVSRHVFNTYESVKTAHTNDDTIAMRVDRHVLDTYEFVKNTHAHDGTMSLCLAAQFSMHAVVVSHLLVGSSPMIIYSTV